MNLHVSPVFLSIIMFFALLVGCNSTNAIASSSGKATSTPTESSSPNPTPPPSTGNKINVTVGDTTWTATLVENVATARLKELLADAPLTIKCNDYGGFEKVGSIGQSLPTADMQTNSSPGDIILYSGSSLVVFYGSNSWSYTRIGKIDNVTENELRKVLGTGSVEITFSLPDGEESKTLIAYFTRTGNTTQLANTIHDTVGRGRRRQDNPLKIMPTPAVAPQLLQQTNNLLNPNKALIIIKAVVLYDSLDFLHCFVAFQLDHCVCAHL